ncbi:hypothetical protein [Maridesulfovibrio sp.]|uniref:hypothetical protein n=1 Tax=Maridesulfovibrio sp. TaxID=2795000 RepID=UPI0037489ED0
MKLETKVIYVAREGELSRAATPSPDPIPSKLFIMLRSFVWENGIGLRYFQIVCTPNVCSLLEQSPKEAVRHLPEVSDRFEFIKGKPPALHGEAQ